MTLDYFAVKKAPGIGAFLCEPFLFRLYRTEVR
ncbi:MAG: hypothetical protein ACI94L_000230 [Flavobacteriaceae bacterium]|jgi:hypothetical protein